MLANRFMYVCAGLLCLALAYHIGAASATAQGEGAVLLGEQGVCTPQGDIYNYFPGTGWTFSPYANVFMGAPAGRTIVQFTGSYALANTGEFFERDNASPGARTWLNRGVSPAGGGTPARVETWGAMKSRYRGERGAAQPALQDR